MESELIVLDEKPVNFRSWAERQLSLSRELISAELFRGVPSKRFYAVLITGDREK